MTQYFTKKKGSLRNAKSKLPASKTFMKQKMRGNSWSSLVNYSRIQVHSDVSCITYWGNMTGWLSNEVTNNEMMVGVRRFPHTE